MEKARIIYERYKWAFVLAAGLFAVLVYCMAYFVLGSESYIQIKDQLDGEVINYIVNARYLFSGQRSVQEFMNGMDISAMTPPAPLGVLLYKLFPPFTAFAVMHIFEVVVGFVGMYLLLRQMTQNPFIVLAVSCLFVYLPFYPVYGLSILGQPLLLWALLGVCGGERPYGRYYFCIVLCAAASSLVLVGFAWLGLCLAALLILGGQTVYRLVM